MTVCIGIDIGKSACVARIMDVDGCILEKGKYPQYHKRC